MHDRRTSGEARISHFLADRLRPALYPERLPMDIGAWHIPGEPMPVESALRADFSLFSAGDAWGAPWSTSWFRLSAEVPERWAGRRVEAIVDLGAGAEALVHDELGTPLQGLHTGNSRVAFRTAATGGEQVRLLVEAAANPGIDAATGGGARYGDPVTAGDAPLYRLTRADLVVRDEDVWHLIHDIDVLAGLMRALPTELPRRHAILRALEHAVDVVDPRDVASGAARARRVLAPVLARRAHETAHTVAAIGHAHPGRGGLRPHRETVRAAARTFSTMATLAEEYPELVLAVGSAQQYAWMKERHPHVFERIRKAVADGNWVPVGGMWAEPDGILPGGESLARQFVLGRRFCREELGTDTDGVWLTGISGVSPAVPQLAALAGAHWLLAHQPAAGARFAPPRHTFWWEGMDGTRLFTHIPPTGPDADERETGAGAALTGDQLAASAAAFSDTGDTGPSLMTFGSAEGGGPTPQLLERARRLTDLEGSPRVEIQHPDRFFADALAEYGGHGAPPEDADSWHDGRRRGAPVWRGELFPGTHPGTYTGQARVKRGNRECEALLREAELWSATAAVTSGVPYPYDELDTLWKQLLALQAGPVLSGASVSWAEEEAEQGHRAIRRRLDRLVLRATGAPDGLTGPGPLVFNAGPLARHEVVLLDGDLASRARADGGQVLLDGRVALLADAPAFGAGRAEPTLGTLRPVTVWANEEGDGGGFSLDNGLLRVSVDARGLVRSAVDAATGRDAIAPGGAGNLLQLHRDDPPRWGAFELDSGYGNSRRDLDQASEVKITDSGPLLATVEVTRSTGRSTVVQRLSLAAGGQVLNVDTDIDWRERDTILKSAWQLDVHTEHTTSEVQFGHVRRPLHSAAEPFAPGEEQWAHRWIHVGEHDWGVAIAGDAGYGYDAARHTRLDGGATTTVRLTLLRSAHTPDPHADRGPQHFRHAIRPGADIGGAIAEGYAIALPLRPGGPEPVSGPLIVSDGQGVVVEAVKLADDRSGDVVVRLYESRGGRATTTLTTAFPLLGAAETDLLEHPLTELPRSGDRVALALRPFQILTLRLVPGGGQDADA